MTFSIVARDPTTGMYGIAVATKHLAVGALVPHAQAGRGAIATQASTNPLLGTQGLRLLARKRSAEDTIASLMRRDKGRDRRQVHVVDGAGNTAAWTGAACVEWAGHLTFPGFSVAGNMLVCGDTIVAMAETYQQLVHVDFAERLLHTLEAGEAAGGDKRGRQSAALYIVDTEIYPYLDLRVDHHGQPLTELRRLLEESRKEYYTSFRNEMSVRRRPTAA